MTRFHVIVTLFLSLASLAIDSPVRAAMFATGFFSGTIERFDETTGARTTFTSFSPAIDPFPGLSGITYSGLNNRFYVSARTSGRVYSVDGTNGSVLDFVQLAPSPTGMEGDQPAGLTTDSAGNVYVALNGGNSIAVYDSGLNPLSSITLPDFGVGNNLPSGLAFDSAGDLVISTFSGVGVLKYDLDTSTTASIAQVPLANGQVAIDSSGDIYVGGAAFSSEVLKFSADGTQIGSPLLTIDDSILPPPSTDPGSNPQGFTSPAGVAIDGDGNLIVAALGRSNPLDPRDGGQSNGGLFKFSPDGSLLQTFATQTTPLSAVTVVAVPEPTSLGLFAIGSVGMVILRHRNRKSSR